MNADFSRRNIGRRRVLRGMMGGGAVMVALPFLDCALNTNGTALAAGRPLPVRFGTWNWGCGMNPQRFVPTKTGADYDLLPELKYIEAHKSQINVFTGFKALLDGKPNLPHISGMQALLSGGVAAQMGPMDAPTIDVLVGDTIGTDTRFRSLEITATGDPKHSYSYRSANGFNPAEGSPVALYTRIFGPDFQDPNAADFKPDPNVMLRKSVLTGVTEQRQDFMRQLGAADRTRMDEYFTSVRQLEQQLELQLQKPPPAEACHPTAKPADGPIGTEIGVVMNNHKIMAETLAMALACNQTKIFNMVFSDSASNLRMPGEQMIHHLMTHEEPVDKTLGYQPKAAYFVERSMEAWALFVATLANIKEGDGTLLDHCLVMGHSDTEFARVHSISGIPVMTAGSAGGRIKTGIHVNAVGEPITRIGFTLQQVMGVPTEKWGQGSMQTNKPVSEILI
jgi:Protein of unknown function (DUF1552)